MAIILAEESKRERDGKENLREEEKRWMDVNSAYLYIIHVKYAPFKFYLLFLM